MKLMDFVSVGLTTMATMLVLQALNGGPVSTGVAIAIGAVIGTIWGVFRALHDET